MNHYSNFINLIIKPFLGDILYSVILFQIYWLESHISVLRFAKEITGNHRQENWIPI